MRSAGLILAAIGAGLIWLQVGGDVAPGPDPEPAGDCLSQAYAADRAARVKMLREMDTTESTQKQIEWHNKRSREILSDGFGAYLDAVAEAIAGGTITDLADELGAVQ